MPLIVKSVETAEKRKSNSASVSNFEEMRNKLRKPVSVKPATNEKQQVVVNGKVIEKPSRYMLDMLLDDQ